DRYSFRAEPALKGLDQRPHAAAERPLDHDHVPRPYRSYKLRGKLLGGLGVSTAAVRRQRLVKWSHQLAAGKDYIYACPLNAIGESFVKFLPLGPELEHVAEHGDAPRVLGQSGKPERCKRCQRRSRFRVVGFIDDGDAPLFAPEEGAG